MRSALALISSLLFLPPQASASGFYPKGSPVLQVDARSYDKLIAKSNYTSIVEFYAPWCGHCKNLKPAYEKAASSLSGYAKVAAIDCDDNSNKQFCGIMGVQGFPTLKIVKPSKKVGGKPIVEDYNGARTKAIFFTEKSVVSPLVKALAIDFLGSIDVAQIKSTESEAATKFKVDSFPQAYIVPSVGKTPEKYDGELKKAPLTEFLSKFAAPNPEFPSSTAHAKAKSKPAAKSKSSSEEASCPAGHKGKNPHTSAAAEHESKLSQSSKPAAASESAMPAPMEPEPTPLLESLDSEDALALSCLNAKLGTCVLAVMLPFAGDDKSALDGLSEIAHKHYLRRARLFPIYSVPSTNPAGQTLVSKLGGTATGEQKAVVLAINPKKRWWSRYIGSSMSQEAIEGWIDNIRFGDFKKERLPEGVAVEMPEPEGKAAKGKAPEDSADHDEL